MVPANAPAGADPAPTSGPAAPGCDGSAGSGLQVPEDSLSVAVLGSGGAGALTTGSLLLEAAGRAGWYGLHTRSVGPQIRGGEAAALVRLGTGPVGAHDDGLHLVAALDWRNVERFAGELVLHPGAAVIHDPDTGEVPEMIATQHPRLCAVPMKALAKRAHGRPNMVALGAIATMIGLPLSCLRAATARLLGGKGAEAMQASAAALDAGADAAGALGVSLALRGTPRPGDGRWLVSGNEACAVGALRGGVRFAAGYPITPATDLLEWLAPALAEVGGTLVQAEDELASVNMLIGASFGGVPALTATSGPGFALMTESLGLAVAAEVPLVVVNVMRGGPSTGIPTKSEQADLDIAVYGLHGDAPHLVLAPTSVADCLMTTQWAVSLAERLQVPAVVLSDQFLGQARAVIERPGKAGWRACRKTPRELGTPYRRYALTADGVSPMAVPGTAGGQYTADGLTHDEFGIPSSRAADHQAQLDKRRDKLHGFDYGRWWAEVEGEGELALLTWGSVTGAVREAAARLRAEGWAVRLVALRLIAPLLADRLAAALAGVRRVLVIEQSHSAQLHRYLRAHLDLPAEVRALHRPGPLTLRPNEIREGVLEWSRTP